MFKIIILSQNHTRIEFILCSNLFDAFRIVHKLAKMKLKARIVNVL